jgi:hypothetical protein
MNVSKHMRISYTKILLLFGLSLAFSSCEQNEKFVDQPYLQWRTSETKYLGDSADNRRVIDLTVYFTDGDGDIGREDLNSIDTCILNDYATFLQRFDLFIYYFEKVNGQFIEIPPTDSCLPFHNILPYLTPIGQNKTLEGDITTPFDYSNYPLNSTDSIKFELQIIDLAGNKSSRITSPAIGV